MKIVQIIPSYNVGGGELLAVRLCAAIKKLQPDCFVYLISLYDPIPSIVYDEALTSGAEIISLGKKKGFSLLAQFRMLGVLRKIKPDIVHTHLAGLRYALLSGLFLKFSLKIHTVHNMASHETFALMRRVHSLAFRKLGWLPVALSIQVQRSIRDVYGVEAPIVNNGVCINQAIFSLDKIKLRDKLKIPKENFTLISIGRLCSQKNQVLLINAFKEICRDENPSTLIIVGIDTTGGSYKHRLEELIDKQNESTKNKIILLGARKDIPELLRASDVFVISSNWEGVPLTLLEAMGYEIPIVSTSVGGIPDVIVSGVNGLLVPKGDSKSLGEAICKLSSNGVFAAMLAKKGKKDFELSHAIENTARDYLNLYYKKVYK